MRTVRVTDDVAAAHWSFATAAAESPGATSPLVSQPPSAARGDDLRIGACPWRSTRSTGQTQPRRGERLAAPFPARRNTTLTVADGHLEIGMGMHGEKGVWSGEMLSADATTDKMLDVLLADRPLNLEAPLPRYWSMGWGQPPAPSC